MAALVSRRLSSAAGSPTLGRRLPSSPIRQERHGYGLTMQTGFGVFGAARSGSPGGNGSTFMIFTVRVRGRPRPDAHD
ncbi:hypothetical protein [Actinoplanes sp. NPDC051851]|uniref:hypothetical protein n=1 Tax=Actinoplanes sp. NPDC051851 TaxID=3154753 RepID=UPI003442DBC0